MATTTATAIRDRCLTVIEAITPVSNIGDRFLRFRNEREADFRAWAQANVQGSVRRFQVRWTGEDDEVETSNGDVERHWVTLTVLVAYPQTHRWGEGDAMDRDRVMDEDRHAIEKAIGLDGAANFTNPNPDATYRGRQVIPFERAEGVDFLVITQKMSFLRQMI